MLRRRKILLAIVIVLVLGSLGSTIGYALHLHSRSLRERITAELCAQLGLDLDIRSITPLSFSSRRFDDIAVRLPDRADEIANVGRAVWRSDVSDSGESFALDIADGWLLTGAGHWTPQDYQMLLKSGFGHDFAALHLTEVNVQRIDLRWRHANFVMTAPAANGAIYFDERGKGRAVLTVYQLNDTPVTEPIHVSAWFTPGEGMTFQKAELRMGAIPLRALGLDRLLGCPVSAGTFAGHIGYRDATAPPWKMEVGGSLSGARLEELTNRVIGGPFSGTVDVNIDRAVFAPGADGHTKLRSLRFGGKLHDLRVAQFAALFREPALNGRIDLAIHQAEFDNPDLKYARLSGKATEVSLEALTRLLGYGVVTGQLEVRLNALAVVDNVIQFADVELIALPPEDGPAYIDKTALVTLGERAFGVNLEPVLPERVEYVRMGAKLLLDREGLRIRGTHGPKNRTILTIKLFDREVGILRKPDRVYPMKDLIALLRAHPKDYDAQRFINWWSDRHDHAGR